MELNRSSVYYKPAPPADAEPAERIKARIDYWHSRFPAAGVRKLRSLLAGEGLQAGRKLLRRYLLEMGIRAIMPKPNLSKRNQAQKIHPYLLRNKAIYLPNQVWAVDITYVKMKHGHMYLTAIIDWYSRFVVGWELSDTLDTAPVLAALKTAMVKYGCPGIINSDQGCQFTSAEYCAFLRENGVRQSMDGKARWVDNVIIERWFRSLKWEDIYLNSYESPAELRAGLRRYIDDYNQLRPHQALDNLTPAAAYRQSFAPAAGAAAPAAA